MSGMYVYVCDGCGAQMTKAAPCRPDCDSDCAHAIEVAPVAEVERLREVLAEIADGYERHNPGWWIKKAKAALAEGTAP